MNFGNSLTGKLEELGLDEILQLVSVSRRTGVLTLKSKGREAVLQFRDGLLVRASSTGFQQSLGELMVQRGAVDAGKIREALAIQQHEGFRERIGTILNKRFQVELNEVEQAVREQITNVLMTLFAWNEGTFDCTPRDEIETVDAAYLDPHQLLLEMEASGFDPAAAALQMSQKLGASEGFAAPEPVAAPSILDAAPVSATVPALVMVDDDTALLDAATAFLKNQYEIATLSRSEEALVKVDALYRNGGRPKALVDLIMPKMDGSGVLGGLELARLFHKNFAELHIVVMSDFHHADAEQELEAMGIPVIIKPRRGDTGGDAFRDFMKTLQELLQ